jgi:two-component system, OmpR family, sensor histidine kinase KdpD
MDPPRHAERPAAVETTPSDEPSPRPREARRSGHGSLRVFLGAAPGSGKTFAMLREGRERVARGEDVVVGFVETYGRPRTIEAIGRLEVLPRLRVPYRGTVLEEMDLDAVLARRPQVALVDELAHTNAPGVRHAKRWEDVEELRDAGIDVVTTVNVQHIESMKDLVEHITGIPVRETVPDQVVDGADEIQFIDITPEALRKRMRHGNIYAQEKVDTALRNFFRRGNLGALREIALRLVAQAAADSRRSVRPPPQDVLVAVSGRASSEGLIRRGVRIARRFGGLCIVLTVVRATEPDQDQALTRIRMIADQLHCSFMVRRSANIAATVMAVAAELGVHHVVVGESVTLPPVWRRQRHLLDRLVDDLPGVNIHVIARVEHPVPLPRREVERPRPDDLLRGLGRRRGALRIYLGYARGVGTTTAMLQEARRRRRRGTDVVAAAVNTQNRAECEDALSEVETLGGGCGPPVPLDVHALLRRNPDVACIDDLTGLCTDGRRRVDALPRILEAGITVIATLHTSNIRSAAGLLGELVPGAVERPLVEDSVLDAADEIELVDVTPTVLEQRLRRGDIMPLAEAANALQGEFRPQVLAALRETTFRLVAEHTDRQLVAYMRERGIERPWEVRPRVMACVPPRPDLEGLIRRAARLADSIDGELHVVTVRTRRRSDVEKDRLAEYARLTHQLGGEFVTLHESQAAPALAAYAREILATEILMARGHRRGRWARGTLRRLIRMLSDVDIHILGGWEETPGATASGSSVTPTRPGG